MPAHETHYSYGAPYYEVSPTEIQSNFYQFLRKIVPEGIHIGSVEKAGAIRIRRFKLPDDPKERERRIKEIQEKGTDRTNPVFDTPYDRRVYIPAARLYNVNPLDIFDTDTPVSLYRHPELLVTESTDKSEQIRHTNSNGILIYDSKHIRQLVGPEYTFMDLQKRNEALLAIIGIFNQEISL